MTKPIKFDELVQILDEITDEETTAVVLITSSSASIEVRRFGSDEECKAALEAALRGWRPLFCVPRL